MQRNLIWPRTMMICLVLLFVVLRQRPCQANPLDMYGFGSRAIGMGGAFTGLADDYSAVFYNPPG
jgi:long-chain fatty acid transport protein